MRIFTVLCFVSCCLSANLLEKMERALEKKEREILNEQASHKQSDSADSQWIVSGGITALAIATPFIGWRVLKWWANRIIVPKNIG